jgi:hypothetical protein
MKGSRPKHSDQGLKQPTVSEKQQKNVKLGMKNLLLLSNFYVVRIQAYLSLYKIEKGKICNTVNLG